MQLSFSAEAMPSPGGGAGLVHSVDVDIDLGRGLAHVVEWLDNNVIRRGHKTDQVLIYGLLYAQRILPLYTLDPVRATTARSAQLAAAFAKSAHVRRRSRRRVQRRAGIAYREGTLSGTP